MGGRKDKYYKAIISLCQTWKQQENIKGHT